MPILALIDYGSGNIRSAYQALMQAASQTKIRWDIRLISKAEDIRSADRILLPGVGHFANCMQALKNQDGLIEALNEKVIGNGTPFLGICVGMQLLADFGLEDGHETGLGWIPGETIALPKLSGLRIPHMGWNAIRPTGQHPVLNHLENDAHMYFVHSYKFVPKDPAHCLAYAKYGREFCAIIAKDNIIGTQFHPEKSQTAGLGFLQNWLEWVV